MCIRDRLLAQAVLMVRFLKSPEKQALFYSGFGVPLFVAGMMVSAFALRLSLIHIYAPRVAMRLLLATQRNR